MSSGRFLCRSSLCLTLFLSVAPAQSNSSVVSAPSSSNWIDILRDLPVVRWFAPSSQASTAEAAPAPAAGFCSVQPLPPVTDANALAFENGSNPQGAVDLAGLRPAMAVALERFRHMVMSVGGTFDLKSAYRPEAYQEHLQEVWFKWMELRANRDPGCQVLRASVEDEFARHHLLETQKPVTSSDHTRGLAFDAVVVLPKAARLRRRAVSLNRLTLLAGLTRPDIFHDPVHFKLALARKGRHV